MRHSVKKTMLWGSLGFFVLVGALIILPWFLNPDYLRSLVLGHIQQTLGSHVKVGRTSLALFPSPHFLVSDIVVKEHADSHAVFRAQSMSLELGIGQLLQKKIVVKEFVLDHPEIEVRRDKSGVWRFLGHSNQRSSFSFLASFFVLGKIEVTNGKIIVIDESPSESVRGMVFEDVAYVSETSYEDVSVLSALNLSGKLRQAQDFASFQLSGTFEATSNVPLSLAEKENMFFEQMGFVGDIQTNNIAVHQLADFMTYGELVSQLPGRFNVDSQIKWMKKGVTSQLQLSNIALANPALTIAGNANVEGLEDGNQMTSVSLRSSNLNLEIIRKVVPEAWLPVPLADLWEKGEWGGELKVLDARVTSSTRLDVGTSVTGTFQVDNGFLRLPQWPETEHVQGTVVVEPDRIHVAEANGVYDGILVAVRKGVFLLKEGGTWSDVEIEGQVPATKVWDFVRGVIPPSSATSNWHTWDVSQGIGLLRLRFSGGMLDEKGLVFQHGEYQPTNMVLHVPGLPYALSKGHGKIQFSPDSTVLEDIAGEMGPHPFSLEGTIIHQNVLRVEPLHVTAEFDGQEVFTPSKASQSAPSLQVKGPLQASVTMRGPISPS